MSAGGIDGDDMEGGGAMTDDERIQAMNELAEKWRLRAVQYRLIAAGFPVVRNVNEAAASACDVCSAELTDLLKVVGR